MLKLRRQQEILKLVRSRHLHTQQQLATALRAAGIEATQVTLSRDIRELGLVKTPQGYHALDAAQPAPDVRQMVSEFVLSVRVAMNQVVLKTSPGSASPVAVAFDQADWPDVVGTIAGDDTILLITPSPAAATALAKRIAP
ncbi:MAG: ArgR family transcriptional regulator [Candidatus Solibacter usitatus]|nr:ArgR family transcriptional regulator [Candidatus Solibacter usitatus]